jgi:hypothetical protein
MSSGPVRLPSVAVLTKIAGAASHLANTAEASLPIEGRTPYRAMSSDLHDLLTIRLRLLDDALNEGLAEVAAHTQDSPRSHSVGWPSRVRGALMRLGSFVTIIRNRHEVRRHALRHRDSSTLNAMPPWALSAQELEELHQISAVLESPELETEVSATGSDRFGVHSRNAPGEEPATIEALRAVPGRVPSESGRAGRRVMPCEGAAFRSWRHACENNPELKDAPFKEVYKWILENGCPQYDENRELPSFETWDSHRLRGAKKYGEPLRKPRKLSLAATKSVAPLGDH